MNTFSRVALWAGITSLVGLTGCVVAARDHGPDHGPYRYEEGVRIDVDGNREEHWCDNHRDDEHCRR